MNKQQKLSKKLNELTKELIGNQLERAFVLIGIGYFANVYNESAANELIEVWKQFPEFNKFSISPIYEDIDIFNEDGELIDVQDGEFLYYRVVAAI